jgi:prolyl-tRNA synthetase
VVVVPCGLTASLAKETKEKVLDRCQELVKELEEAGVRAYGDFRTNVSPGWKFNHWELKVNSPFCLQC